MNSKYCLLEWHTTSKIKACGWHPIVPRTILVTHVDNEINPYRNMMIGEKTVEQIMLTNVKKVISCLWKEFEIYSKSETKCDGGL